MVLVELQLTLGLPIPTPWQDLAITFGTDPPLYTKPPNWMSSMPLSPPAQPRPPQAGASGDPAAFQNPLVSG